MDIEIESMRGLLEEAWGDVVPLKKALFEQFIDRVEYLKDYYDQVGADTDD